MNRKTIVRAAIGIFAVIGLCYGVWRACLRPAEVALLSFQPFQVAKIAKSNTNSHVRYTPLTIDDIRSIGDYDACLIFGMGIRMTDYHRGELQKAIDKGLKVYTTSATDEDNNICTLDSTQKSRIGDYLKYGGAENYASMANYIKGEVLAHKLFVGEIKEPVETSDEVFFRKEGEPTFKSFEEYEKWYKEQEGYTEGGKRVAIIPGMMSPSNSSQEHTDNLISELEKKGINCYAFSGVRDRIKNLEEIKPDAVVFFPHGRLVMGKAELGTEYLKKRNIPMLCPLLTNSTYDEWVKDKMGMMGGFMSQSVVMPEIDGGVCPQTVVVQYINEEGLYVFNTIPEKLEQFAGTVDKYLNLKTKKNKDKKVAICYFKGAGSSAMTAAGLEVAPSLYNLLKKMKEEGYDVSGLPENEVKFEEMIMKEGAVFASYEEGKRETFRKSGKAGIVCKEELEKWMECTLAKSMRDTLEKKYGEADDTIAFARIMLGNVCLFPQPVQGTGANDFAAVHGSNAVPPYEYIAPYMWVRNKFEADALIHFGTHGSLEFVPGKQVALSAEDWTDRLVMDLPNIYLYTIADVGEGVIAKRRSYAELVSHLNPPFTDGDMGKSVEKLMDMTRKHLDGSSDLRGEIKREVARMGMCKDLGIDSSMNKSLTDEEIEKIESYAQEIASERITDGLYTLGVPFEKEDIEKGAEMMSTEPLAYAMARLDVLKGKAKEKDIENRARFERMYGEKARRIVRDILSGKKSDAKAVVKEIGITDEEIAKADSLSERMKPRMSRMMSAMMEMAAKSGGKMGRPSGVSKGSGEMSDFVKKMIAERKAAEEKERAKENDRIARAAMMNGVSKEEREFAEAARCVINSVERVREYKMALMMSPMTELESVMNALNGGYTEASSGGDFVANAEALPTGRNLYSINAEATPSVRAWDKGVKMANAMIEEYKKEHNDSLPRKVSFTLWSGAFIESEGATLAEILYLLGAESVRDQMQRVIDVRLIPKEQLGRPRIDVIVQTSGQFRDIAASRLELLNKAVRMAAEAEDEGDNYVREGKRMAERVLLDKGFTPAEAEELSTSRVFGGLNGMSGTGITAMVESGDKWEDEGEIAEVYMNNMGAEYGSAKKWGDFKKGVMEAALQNTDAVVQPRQSNTWGALSLDHVYEFMGGMNTAVKKVTGKSPENYLNDLRNRNNARVQGLSEAIGVESRATIFNPKYIKGQMKGGASSAAGVGEIVKNMYGWSAMRKDVIGDDMWNEVYETYIKDKHGLKVAEWMEEKSPATIQEMTAVMLETARKGLWNASEEQVSELVKRHTELVEKYGAEGKFTCDNEKLRKYIGERSENKEAYEAKIKEAREAVASEGIVMKKERMNEEEETKGAGARTVLWVFGVLVVMGAVVVLRKRRK